MDRGLNDGFLAESSSPSSGSSSVLEVPKDTATPAATPTPDDDVEMIVIEPEPEKPKTNPISKSADEVIDMIQMDEYIDDDLAYPPSDDDWEPEMNKETAQHSGTGSQENEQEPPTPMQQGGLPPPPES